ncbi:MAG: hypothetical protein EBR60_08795 [Burkholderiaceae bacterium]|nr:hypothetical protein [Burkholderiaceae bacterium]
MTIHYQGQTGPKSAAGKRIASLNALRTGLFAKTPLLPFEDEARYKQHIKLVWQSLKPEDAVQVQLVQQIADSMWRGMRQELRAALHREEIFKQLTPRILAGLMSIDESLVPYAPPFLVTPNHRFGRAILKQSRQRHQQYLHLQQNVRGVANYNMVWRSYPEFFQGMHQWFANTISPRIFMSNNQGIEIHWQNRPKDLEAMIVEYGSHLWYVTHFDELRAKIRTWMAIWFFLKGRHSHEVEMYDEIVLRERRSCQLLLDSFFKMRKSQMDHALMMDSRLSLALPNTLEGIDVTVMNPAEIPEPKKRSAKNEMANLEDESSTS